MITLTRLPWFVLSRSRPGSATIVIVADAGRIVFTNNFEEPIADVTAPQILALYEPWFGHPRHISVGYSSHDPVVIRKQMDEAKALGISGFVVDWYGDREPFLDRSYALLQTISAEKHFQVAMMYDELDAEEAEATDDAFAAFNKFNETYLSPNRKFVDLPDLINEMDPLRDFSEACRRELQSSHAR